MSRFALVPIVDDRASPSSLDWAGDGRKPGQLRRKNPDRWTKDATRDPVLPDRRNREMQEERDDLISESSSVDTFGAAPSERSQGSNRAIRAPRKLPSIPYERGREDGDDWGVGPGAGVLTSHRSAASSEHSNGRKGGCFRTHRCVFVLAFFLACAGASAIVVGIWFWPRADTLKSFGDKSGRIAPPSAQPAAGPASGSGGGVVNTSQTETASLDSCRGRPSCFEGWGTSLAWDSITLAGLSDAAKTTYLDGVFDKERGWGLNHVRYNIAGGENPDPSHYRGFSASHFQFDTRIPGFQPRAGVWDWTADQNQRWMLIEARRRGVNVFEAYSSGPPYWMTYSNCSAGGYQASVNNLRDEMYPAFADYLAEVVRFFRTDPSLNVTFRYLAPLNEPTGVWWVAGNRQEGCYFSADGQRRIIAEVASALAKRGLSGTSISGADDFDVPTALSSLGQLGDGVLMNIAQLNAHGYGDPSSDVRSGLAAFARGRGKRVSMTEYGCCLPERTDGFDQTDLGKALITARQIQIDLVALEVSSWFVWQPTWTFLKISGDSITFLKPYYALLQFSKFIRPGAQIIQSNDPDTLASVAENGQLTLVLVNLSTVPLIKSFDLTAFRVSNTVATYRTDAFSDFAKSTLLFDPNQRLTVTIPKESVTSLVFTPAASA